MIKNYTSKAKTTFDTIQKSLIAHGAKQIMFEYDDGGQVKSLNFALVIGERTCGFQLPARVDKVELIFYKNKKPRYNWQQAEPLTEDEKAQAYRTAWANIRDWITAQLALIETEQVKMEEVFLPYMIIGKDKTLFEGMRDNQFLLPSGKGGE